MADEPLSPPEHLSRANHRCCARKITGGRRGNEKENLEAWRRNGWT